MCVVIVEKPIGEFIIFYSLKSVCRPIKLSRTQQVIHTNPRDRIFHSALSKPQKYGANSRAPHQRPHTIKHPLFEAYASRICSYLFLSRYIYPMVMRREWSPLWYMQLTHIKICLGDKCRLKHYFAPIDSTLLTAHTSIQTRTMYWISYNKNSISDTLRTIVVKHILNFNSIC